MRSSLEYLKKALQIKRLLSYMIEDLIQSRYILLLSLLFAMIILIIYMFLLRYLASMDYLVIINIMYYCICTCC